MINKQSMREDRICILLLAEHSTQFLEGGVVWVWVAVCTGLGSGGVVTGRGRDIALDDMATADSQLFKFEFFAVSNYSRSSASGLC